MKDKKLTTYQMAVTAVMAAVLCVLGPLTVPIGAVPISLANFVICLTAWLLGPKFGTLSVVIYLVLGAIGIPVFSGYGAGLAKLAGPTGGYLVGYLLLAFIGIQQWRIRMMYRVESARQRESESLAKYSNLFNAMSIVYIQMKVIYDENGNPADALYCDVNSRYERIFIPREQAIGRRVSELFPFPMTEFMRLIKIAQTENRTITYPYYYEPRDIFYEVVISRSYLEEHIDIFCLDGTALYKTQQKLDSINHKLAMALDVADIVPWKWDLRKGSILCDVNKSVHGQMLAGTNADQQLEVPSESYFAKIHKEDRERVRRAYDDLIAGRKDKVREEYRVASEVSARTGEAFVPSTYKQPFVDVNTYELTYVSLVEGHLIPYFGAARLSDIRPADIQAYFATRTECLESRLKK